jgi:hypothetical protein
LIGYQRQIESRKSLLQEAFLIFRFVGIFVDVVSAVQAPVYDLSDANVRALNQLRYEAHCLPIEELDHNARYSVVSTADVLEHMQFRKTGLAAAHRLLRRDGVLFLSMPHMNNMVWRLLHANGVNPYWGKIEHTHNFPASGFTRSWKSMGLVDSRSPLTNGDRRIFAKGACQRVTARAS